MSGKTVVLPTAEEIADVLGRTIDGEAEGCGELGMHAVANVIINRADHPRWWGKSIIGVCRQPWQFSCWNDGPDHDRIVALNAATNPWFQTAMRIANLAVARQLPDITVGADSYYALSMHTPPTWAKHATETYRDHWHVFFRVELPAPPNTSPDVRNVSGKPPAVTAPTSST